MTGCTYAANHRQPRSCGQPGSRVRLGCVHEHIYTATVCAVHRAGNLLCHFCATGPGGHRCPLTVLVEAAA